MELGINERVNRDVFLCCCCNVFAFAVCSDIFFL